eukprot:gnl/Ergobibamus_cyprinoides/118.p1 GENE.gnl/Ergobibamus_cyprinoides/118~~gnl/Ergobibamus_cyprinoides/118.p1  ORF type:complete len:289 (+),score=102.18 gnl/Ergobibamus_cyprinoides/118:359-1225(+)
MNVPVGRTNYYSWLATVMPASVVVSPCRGLPHLFVDPYDAYVTPENAVVAKMPEFGNEAVWRFEEDSWPEMVNMFFSVSQANLDGQDPTNSGAFSYELFVFDQDIRPVPAYSGRMDKVKAKKNSVTVEFAPAYISGETSPEDVVYGLYVMALPPKNSASNYADLPVPTTACGMMQGGTPAYTSSGSQWVTFSEYPDPMKKNAVYTISSNVDLPEGEKKLYVTIVAKSLKTNTYVAYETVTVKLHSAAWLWWLLAILVIGGGLAAGYYYYTQQPPRRRVVGSTYSRIEG